jgi:rhodanese-related sulfurtransferase
VKNLPSNEILQLLTENKDILLLDVREKWEFEICNIEKSVNIPMAEISLAAASLDSSRDTIVICHHGARSMQVASFLEHSGFSNVINLDGGIDAWAKTIDPNMQQY